MRIFALILDLYASPHFVFEKYYFSYFRLGKNKGAPGLKAKLESSSFFTTLPLSIFLYIISVNNHIIELPGHGSIADLIVPGVVMFLIGIIDKEIFYGTKLAESLRKKYELKNNFEKVVLFIVGYGTIALPAAICIVKLRSQLR